MRANEGIQQVVALVAMGALVAIALWIGGPQPASDVAQGATQQFWGEVETGGDHIDSIDLARRMLAGRERIAIVDVRPEDEFAQFHLRSATQMSVPDLVGARGDALFAQGHDLVVVCSNGPAHPAQAWVELRRKGRSNVRVLDGGLDEFRRAVLTPPSLAGDVDSASASARRGFVELARQSLIANNKANPASGWASDPAKLEAPCIVSAAWAANRTEDLVIVDARPRADFLALHARSAVHVNIADLRLRHGDRDLLMRNASDLAERFSQMGIAMTTPVAIVADRFHDASFVALAFLRTGHRAVAIVDGGMRAWARGGYPLVDAIAERASAQHEVIEGADDFTMSIDELSAFVRDSRGTVIDSRPRAQFDGREGQEARRGHVPGAKCRPLVADFDSHSGQLLDRAALEAAYSALGADRSTPVALMCRTGHQASQHLFVLRFLLGHNDVMWCNGSFTLWAERTDLPIEGASIQ